MRRTRILLMCALSALAAVPAWADWDEGDSHKMHYPQLPDPNGWDVVWDALSTYELADDWQCSETGLVEDVHFWISFAGDAVPEDLQDLGPVSVEIYSNNPATETTPSSPKDLLWGHSFEKGAYHVRENGEGDQGLITPSFNPPMLDFDPHDHDKFYQVNITDIPDPFTQHKDEIYWLALHIDPVGLPGTPGWKTSRSPQFMDAAVYGPDPWIPLHYQDGSKLDLAFVITGSALIPEPSTLVLAVVALLGLLRGRRRFSL